MNVRVSKEVTLGWSNKWGSGRVGMWHAWYRTENNTDFLCKPWRKTQLGRPTHKRNSIKPILRSAMGVGWTRLA